MARTKHSAEEIREELERVAEQLSHNGEYLDVGFRLPALAEGEWPFEHNWDVSVAVPEGLEDLAFRAIEDVASRWDLRKS